MLLHYLAKLKKRKLYLFTYMFHVDLPIDTQHKSHRNNHLITVRLLFIHKTIGSVHQTRPRKGTKAFRCLFCTHLTITISAMHGVRPLGHNVKNGSFSSSSMNYMSMDSITEMFYHGNKMLIATKHVADNNFVFQ